MRKKITVRGQVVEIDEDKRIIYMKLRRPNGKWFSISDKLADMVNNGFELHVEISGGRVQIITDMSKAFKEEEVKSKYAGAPPWHTYWFLEDKEPTEEQPTGEQPRLEPCW